MLQVTFVIVFFCQSESIEAQQLLESNFDFIKDEAKIYSEEVAALFYRESPIALIVSRDRLSIDYAKYYMFYNSICVSETHFSPADEYGKKMNYLTMLYGEPTVSNSISNWMENDLQVTLTLTFSKMHKKEVCQINYAKIASHEKIKDITEKMQTPFIKMVTIKTNANGK